MIQIQANPAKAAEAGRHLDTKRAKSRTYKIPMGIIAVPAAPFFESLFWQPSRVVRQKWCTLGCTLDVAVIQVREVFGRIKII